MSIDSWINAGGSTIGSIFSALMGYHANMQAIQAEQENVRQTNQSNEDLYRENLAQQMQMYLDAQQWNMPVHEMERLIAAGVHPMAAANKITGGNMQPMQLPNAPRKEKPETSQYVAQAYSSLGGIGNLAPALADILTETSQNEYIREQTESIRLKNQEQRIYLEKKFPIEMNIIELYRDALVNDKNMSIIKNKSEELGYQIQKEELYKVELGNEILFEQLQRIIKENELFEDNEATRQMLELKAKTLENQRKELDLEIEKAYGKKKRKLELQIMDTDLALNRVRRYLTEEQITSLSVENRRELWSEDWDKYVGAAAPVFRGIMDILKLLLNKKR